MVEVQKRGALLASLASTESTLITQSDFWDEFSSRIHRDEVIPIISNTLINNCIFGTGCQPEPGSPSVEDQLAQFWAKKIDYPLPDQSDLAHVAQYDQVINALDRKQSTSNYLKFLKQTLLLWARKNDNVSAPLLKELMARARDDSFTDLVRELGYEHRLTSLKILASLPLSIYVTTSPHELLENALREVEREPHTEVCFWTDNAVSDEHNTDPTWRPTPEHPLVFHLLGLERYPTTLVLSEDDYLDFLVSINKGAGSRNSLIPLYLGQALTNSSLMLLGYRLQDWDFRVLFRGIISQKPSTLRWLSLIIQLSPEQQYQNSNAEKARHYLEKYFQTSNFRVEWTETGLDSFIDRLWKEWQQWRQA